MIRKLTFKFDPQASKEDVDHYRLVEMDNIFPSEWCYLFTPQGKKTEEAVTLYVNDLYSDVEIKSIQRSNKFINTEFKFIN
jgi:hypothetical protein